MKKGNKKKDINPFYRRQKDPSSNDLLFPMRLNKFIAKSGICSRRKAVDIVREGKIEVNREVILEPFHLVQENDVVLFQGKRLKPEENLIYFLLNKPKDTISTTSDEKGRKTVLDLIQFEGKERLYPVGRLDRNTTGLILLTNDGELMKKLSHPSHRVKKKYKVTLDKPLIREDLEKIEQGLTLDDGLAPVEAIEYLSTTGTEILVTLVLGKNRIVRRIFESLEYEVRYLDRIYYAGLDKKGLPRGQYRSLTSREIIMLKHFT